MRTTHPSRNDMILWNMAKDSSYSTWHVLHSGAMKAMNGQFGLSVKCSWSWLSPVSRISAYSRGGEDRSGTPVEMCGEGFGEALKPQRAIGIWGLHCCHGLNRSHVLNANYRFVSHSSPHSHLRKKKKSRITLLLKKNILQSHLEMAFIFRMNVL